MRKCPLYLLWLYLHLTSTRLLEHRVLGLLLLGTNQGIQRCQNEEIQQECTQSQQLLCVEQEDLGEQD